MNEPSFDAKSPVAMKDSDIWTRLANGGGAFDAKPPVANGGSDKPGTTIVCVEEPDQCSFIGTVSDPTPFDWVLRYIARGWHPVPVPYMGKRPVTKAWQNQHIDAGNATEFFKPRGRWNIGVQLGPDLDCPEAVDIAPRFFPGTNAVFGRAGKKHSHALYYSPSLVGSTAKASLQFLDPDIADKQKAMLLELRCGGNNGKGAQSVFPGSVHSSNELIFWHAFGEPALIDGEVLRTAANLTASASLLIRGWPGPGAMHNAALVVGSFLARLGWTIPQAESFLTIVLEGAGANPEAVRCVEPAFQKLADEEPMPGFPRLAEVFGEKRAKSIAEWLGYQKCPERQVLERPHVTEIEPGQLSDTICLDPGNLPYVIRAMEDRLLEHPELSLYQRGGRMTKIHEDTFKRPDETVTTALVIDEVEKYELLLDVTRVALFDRHNERGEDVPADPTTVHINTLMALKYRSRLPRLTGVIESPLLLPNGRLIEEHGYDEATGLFFDTGGVEFPRMPQRPDKTECLAALKLLDDSLLSEFPFVDETSRSVALSGLLTGVSRPALMLVPMHAYSAPEAGTGKSYLADLVVLLATGRLAAAINAGKDEEELEKRLDGLLLKSINNVVISNIYDAIECAKLSDMLSQRRLHVRMLGGNSAKHMRVIENYAFVQATGNNLKIEGELGRRTLYCEMDAKCERPELRGFQQKPHELLMKNRGPYVSAANSILRGLRCSGFPPQEPLNNYEDWCARVRDALVWLGREDPVKSQEKIRGRDAKLSARQGVMTFWRDRYGDTRRTAGEVIKEAIAEQAAFNKIRFKGEYPPNLSLVETGADCVAINTAHQQKWDLMMAKPSFFDALLQVCEDKGKLSATRFGKWLDGNAGRIAGGYCFQKDGTAHGGAVYWKCAKP